MLCLYLTKVSNSEKLSLEKVWKFSKKPGNLVCSKLRRYPLECLLARVWSVGRGNDCFWHSSVQSLWRWSTCDDDNLHSAPWLLYPLNVLRGCQANWSIKAASHNAMMTFRERACTVWKSRVTGVPMSQWKVLKAGAQPFDCYYYCVRFLVFFQNNVTWQCRRCTNISASFLTDQNLFKKKRS